MSVKALSAALLILILTSVRPALLRSEPGSAGFNSPANLILTTKDYALASDESFSCFGFINGFLTLPNRETGHHTMQTRWIMPNGTVKENVNISLDFDPPGRQTAHIWLQFREKGDGFLGSLSSLSGPSDGTSPYNGIWQVEVKWDDKPAVQSNFRVRC